MVFCSATVTLFFRLPVAHTQHILPTSKPPQSISHHGITTTRTTSSHDRHSPNTEVCIHSTLRTC